MRYTVYLEEDFIADNLHITDAVYDGYNLYHAKDAYFSQVDDNDFMLPCVLFIDGELFNGGVNTL